MKAATLETEYESHQSCLISGTADLKTLAGYEDHYLVKSKKTGFVFCSRIPTEKELIDHYSQYSRNNFISPITINNYQELLKSFEPFRKTGKILDVGCGDGYFLAEAKKMGWEVYGTEFTDDAIEVCSEKGIKMKQGILNPDHYAPDFFDVITSFEVLEHINNPQEEVKNIHSILRKGGLVYLTTPNFNAIERYILKERYSVIEYPEHLSYYTPKTLNYLFQKNGFRKKDIKTTGISITRIKNTLKPAEVESLVAKDSTDEVIRRKMSSNPILSFSKEAANFLLSTFGVGNSLKGWFIKA